MDKPISSQDSNDDKIGNQFETTPESRQEENLNVPIVDLSLSDNFLMQKEITERLEMNDIPRISEKKFQSYFEFNGTSSLKSAISDFFNRHHRPAQTVIPSEFIVMPGATSCLDALSFALFEANDICLILAPFFWKLSQFIGLRNQVQLVPIHLKSMPNEDGISFDLRSETIEEKILDCLQDGRRPKALFLTNPQNPLGDVYGLKLLEEISKICTKYDMHLISDEIFAFSVFDPEAEFKSVLAIDDIPNPRKVHVIWSISKDLALGGMRCGFIHTRNKEILGNLKAVALHQNTPSLVQEVLATLLNDKDWLDNYFFPLSKQRMRERYEYAVGLFKQIGVHVRPAKAGVFIWADLRQFLSSQTFESEMELLNEFEAVKVKVCPGRLYKCEVPGWFRFAVFNDLEELEMGMERITSVLLKRSERQTRRILPEKQNQP